MPASVSLAFAAAVAGDIYNMTSLLQYGWNGDATLGSWLTSNCNWVVEGLKGLENSAGALSSAGIGYGQFLLNATVDKAWFPTWQETMENVFVGGCSSICRRKGTCAIFQTFETFNHPIAIGCQPRTEGCITIPTILEE